MRNSVPIYVGVEHAWKAKVLVEEDALVFGAGFHELNVSVSIRVSV